MIKTGLPYDFDEMDDIQKNGCTIDMNHINFLNISEIDIPRTSFIFLRNTGFSPIILDFSSCDYDRKEKFLMEYLCTDIDAPYDIFAKEWICILLNFILKEHELHKILTNEEMDKFVKEHTGILKELFRFAVSLPIFCMYYHKLNGLAYDVDELEKRDSELFGENIYHIISDSQFDRIYCIHTNAEPIFYTKYFFKENKKLLESVSNLPFFAILYGLTNKPKTFWEKMFQ